MVGNLSNELKQIRRIKGVSLRDVEKATGISNAYLSQLERGDAKNPSLSKLKILAQFYGVSPESLLKSAGFYSEEDSGRSIDSRNKKYGSTASTKKQSSVMHEALLSAELSHDEENQVAEYIAFIKSKRKK